MKGAKNTEHVYIQQIIDNQAKLEDSYPQYLSFHDILENKGFLSETVINNTSTIIQNLKQFYAKSVIAIDIEKENVLEYSTHQQNEQKNRNTFSTTPNTSKSEHQPKKVQGLDPSKIQPTKPQSEKNPEEGRIKIEKENGGVEKTKNLGSGQEINNQRKTPIIQRPTKSSPIKISKLSEQTKVFESSIPIDNKPKETKEKTNEVPKEETNQKEKPEKQKAETNEIQKPKENIRNRDSFILNVKDINIPYNHKVEDTPRYSVASILKERKHEIAILDRITHKLYKMVIEENIPKFSNEDTEYIAIATYQNDFVFSKPDGIYQNGKCILELKDPFIIRSDPIDQNRLWILGTDSKLNVLNSGEIKVFTKNVYSFDITPKRILIIHNVGAKIWDRSDSIFEPLYEEKYNENDEMPYFLDDAKIIKYSEKNRTVSIKNIENESITKISDVTGLLKIDETTIVTSKYVRCGKRVYNVNADIAVIDCGWIFYIKDGYPFGENKSIELINEAQQKKQLIIEKIEKETTKLMEDISQSHEKAIDNLKKITLVTDEFYDIYPHLVAIGATLDSLKELCCLGKEDMAFSLVSEKSFEEFNELSMGDVLKNAVSNDKLSESTIIQIMNHLNDGIKKDPRMYVPITKEALLCLSEESFPSAKPSANEMLPTVLKIHRDIIGNVPYKNDIRILAHTLVSIGNESYNF